MARMRGRNPVHRCGPPRCQLMQLLALLTVDGSTGITDAMIDKLLHESGPTPISH